MADIVDRRTVQLEIRLSGIEQSLARLQDIEKYSKAGADGFDSLTRAIGLSKSALGVIGVTASVAGIIALAKSTNDAVAAFKDFGTQAGTTASALSKFEAPARLAGSSIEAVSNAIYRMSRAAVEARDPNSKAAQALQAIGLESEKLRGLKPDELFETVARQVSKYSDGVEKSAIMQELFGKSGREMSRVIEEIAGKSELSASVTEEQAEAAKKLQDQIVMLQMNGDKFWRSLQSDWVPAINNVVAAFIRAKGEGSLLDGVIQALSQSFTEMANNDGAAAQLRKVNKEIADLRKANDNLQNAGWGAGGLFGDKDKWQAENLARINELLVKRAQLEKQISQEEIEAQNKRALAGQKPTANFDPAAFEAARKYATQLQALYDRLDNTTAGVNQKFWDELRVLHAEFEKGGMTLEKYQARVAALIAQTGYGKDVQRQLAEAAKAANDEAQRAIDIEDRLLASREKAVKNLREYVERLELETQFIGLSNGERARAIALLELQRQGFDANSDAVQRFVNRIKGAIDAQEAIRNQVSVWDDLANRGARFFDQLLTSGRSAFDVLKSSLRSFASEIIAFFARKFILQIGASVLAGTQAGTALAGQAAGFGSGSILGALSGGAIGAVGEFSSALAGTFVGPVAPGLSAAGLGEGIASLVGAIPVWGQIAIGIAVIAGILSRSRSGGPKDEGQFTGAFSSSGQLAGPAAAGFNIIGTSSNSAAQKFTESLAQQIAAAIKAFGGTGSSFQLGAGIVRDPAGSAPTFVDTLLRSATGQELFRQHNANVGRSDEDLNAELQLQGQRVILAALQNSALPPLIAGIINTVDAATATVDQINAIMSQAQAAQTAWAQFQDAFSSDADKLSAAQEKVNSGFAALGIAVPKSSADFKKLVDGLDLSSEAGRNTFAALVDLVPAFKAVEDASAQAAAKLQEDWEAAQSSLDALLGRDRRPDQLAGLLSQLGASNSQFFGLSLSQFIAQFSQVTQDQFAQYSAADQELIKAILALAATMTNTATTIVDAVQRIEPTNVENSLTAQFQSKYGSLIQAQPTLMDQLSLQYRLMQEQIAKWQSQLSGLSPIDPTYQGILAAIKDFQQVLGKITTDPFTGNQIATGLVGDISKLMILTAQYGSDKADQLFALDKWYDEQVKLVGGSQEALLALEKLYGEKRAAILASTSQAGVDELANIQKSILEWRDSLLTGNLSPLTGRQRFQTALSQYDSIVSAAMGGDIEALRQYRDISQTLLELGIQNFGSSSSQYRDLFDRILADSLNLGTPDDALAQAVNDQTAALLASDDETQELLQRLIQAVNTNTQETASQTTELTTDYTTRL